MENCKYKFVQSIVYSEKVKKHMELCMDNNQICNCKRCNGIAHEVKRGDTLYTLSRLYNVSVGNIMKENKGINPYNLMIGEKICMPMTEEILVICQTVKWK